MEKAGCAALGRRKRKIPWFKKKCQPWNAGAPTSSPADKAFGKRETKQLKKGLTRDEFDRSFNPNQVGEFVPIAAKMLDADCHSSSGAVLRPKHSEESQVERILQDKKEDEEIRSYTEVHLP